MKTRAGPDRFGAVGRVCPGLAVANTSLPVVILCLLLTVSQIAGASLPVSESQLKAAWLLNFAKLTEWPQEAFADNTEPIVIGVMGDTTFEEQLARSLAGKLAHGRSFEVRPVEEANEALFCLMLFLGSDSGDRRAETLRLLNNSPVLTIDDSVGADSSGCVLKFLRLDNKIRFHVDLESANAAGVKLDPKLLEVAHSVNGKLQRRPDNSP